MTDIHDKLRESLPIIKHKEIVAMTDQQLKIFWLPDEVQVEKDIQDVLVNFSESEKHGVITTLKLFSLYEIAAGEEFWGNRFKRMFKGHEFQRMASVFSMFEMAIHETFYNKINELLHLNDTDFYLSYLDNPTLKARITHIGDIIGSGSDLETLGVFSMVEGVVLYSAFAYLKHFQSQGKNKLLNIVRGINFSLRDEYLHAIASAHCFKLKLAEANLSKEELKALEETIKTGAAKILEHETEIIRMVFEKGQIPGITEKQLVNFVQSRINECLLNLGFGKMYEVTYNPIAEWFYTSIQNYTFNDFFSGMGNSYHRSWDESAFVWNKE